MVMMMFDNDDDCGDDHGGSGGNDDDDNDDHDDDHDDDACFEADTLQNIISETNASVDPTPFPSQPTWFSKARKLSTI